MKKVTNDGEVIYDNQSPTMRLVEPPFFKTPWNHDRDAESNRTATSKFEKSKTQQQFAKDADINVILAKFMNTGELNLTGQPIYQDIEKEFDLQDNMVTRYQVEQAWEELPAAVRNILKDPKVFVDYIDHCTKTGDLEPLRELGLVEPEPLQQAITGGAGTPAAPPTPETAPTAPKTAS